MATKRNGGRGGGREGRSGRARARDLCLALVLTSLWLGVNSFAWWALREVGSRVKLVDDYGEGMVEEEEELAGGGEAAEWWSRVATTTAATTEAVDFDFVGPGDIGWT